MSGLVTIRCFGRLLSVTRKSITQNGPLRFRWSDDLARKYMSMPATRGIKRQEIFLEAPEFSHRGSMESYRL